MDFSYKWADNWPYLEFIYLIFSMSPSVVVCITMGYLFHVWGGVGVGLYTELFVLNCYVLGGEFFFYISCLSIYIHSRYSETAGDTLADIILYNILFR